MMALTDDEVRSIEIVEIWNQWDLEFRRRVVAEDRADRLASVLCAMAFETGRRDNVETFRPDPRDPIQRPWVVATPHLFVAGDEVTP